MLFGEFDCNFHWQQTEFWMKAICAIVFRGLAGWEAFAKFTENNHAQ
jgi:hypothetical protein